ncbi:transglutaminase domain-containing protein [Paenibacillus tarimensis]
MERSNRLFDIVKREWYRKLTFLFIAVLLWQLFETLEGYWWEETFSIVHGVLIAGTAIEMLFSGKRTLRGVLQLAAILAVNLYYTGFQYVPKGEGPWNEWQLWTDWFAANAGQLDPFLWISLAVWALLLSAGHWTRTRLQVIILIAFCLVTLLIGDSFSPLILWDNVAWSVFVGLAWLVAEHFSRFQAKHPDSWNHLIDYPASLILPTLLILALVMSSGLFVPSIAPVIKDPYTVWMESRGVAVPSFVGDKGSAGSTPSSTGDSRSGYSRQDDLLGEGFLFDYSTVMQVSTSHRSYWRGETKAFYTGDGWMDGPSERRESSVIGLMNGESLPVIDGAGETVETIEIVQTVTMVREEPLPVLFGAGPIRRITSLGIGDDQLSIPGRMAWLPASWELRWPLERSDVPYPTTYSLVSNVPILDEAGLREAGAILNGEQKNDIYLQLPDSLPARVRELAQEITRDAASDYDKAKLIEQYLKTEYPYTNTPDTGKRSSSDFVDAFLFEIQEGYCDYFSSAMAVLGRSAGLPTRWVKGYAPGISAIEETFFGGQPDMFDIDPNGSGTYTVRNADAHSWVEVYFEGYGWIPFEPTSGFAFPYSYAQQAQDISIDEIAPGTDPEPLETASSPVNVKLYAAAAFTAAAIAVAVLAIMRRRQIAAAFVRWRYRTYTTNQRIVLETEKLLRYGRRNGLNYSEQDTVRETVSHWSKVRRSLSEDFHEALRMFEKARYSGLTVTQDEAEQYAAKIKSIRERL